MPKPRVLAGRTCPAAFQAALDAMDVIGNWEWDATTDRIRADAFVALLFNLDPEGAEAGLSLTAYVAGMHPEDRQRVLARIRKCAKEGSAYIAEYRVCSADGLTRWVLGRGRFCHDHIGRPLSGRGIIVDITRMRMAEGRAEPASNILAVEPPLERAAEYAIAAHQAVAELQDPDLKALADALLFSLGCKLAQQDAHEQHERMN